MANDMKIQDGAPANRAALQAMSIDHGHGLRQKPSAMACSDVRKDWSPHSQEALTGDVGWAHIVTWWVSHFRVRCFIC